MHKGFKRSREMVEELAKPALDFLSLVQDDPDIDLQVLALKDSIGRMGDLFSAAENPDKKVALFEFGLTPQLFYAFDCAPLCLETFPGMFTSGKKKVFYEFVEKAEIQHISRRILAFWQEEVDKEPDVIKALKNMSVTYYKRMAKHPQELRVQFQAIAETSDPEISEHLRKDHMGYMRFIGKVLNKGKRQGKIRKDIDVETLSWLLDGVGILMNMTNLLSFKEKFNEDEVLKLTNHIIDSIKT